MPRGGIRDDCCGADAGIVQLAVEKLKVYLTIFGIVELALLHATAGVVTRVMLSRLLFKPPPMRTGKFRTVPYSM